MTRNNITGKIKTTLILVVLSVFLICTFGFMTACKKDETSYTENTYSREWTDEQKITNGNFEYGTDEFVATSYPQTSSISGWSVGTDNSSISSSVKSGIISTADADWEELLNTICDDNVLSKDKLTNPSTHDDASGTKMLMINNYQSTYKGLGAGQKATSATKITLKNGTYNKISVWVKTANITGNGENLGANITLVNTVADKTVSPYRINGIKADNWTQYTIYVKADDFEQCTVDVVLGLGYGDGSSTNAKYYVEGTAYFDDVVYEEIDASELPSNIPTSYFTYNSEGKYDETKKTANLGTEYFYDMSLEKAISENTPSTFRKTLDFDDFIANTIKSYSGIEPAYELEEGKVKITLNETSLELNTSAILPRESYNVVYFTIEKSLGNINADDIKVYIFDVHDEKEVLRTTITPTFDDGKARVSALIKNNFPDDDDSYSDNEHGYKISLVIGPADKTANNYNYQYPTGTVKLSAPIVYSGKTYQYVKNSDPKEKTANYDYYDLLSLTTNGTASLYVGYSEDYQKDSADTYTISVAPANTGDVTTMPTNAEGYTGVVTDSMYLKQDSTNAEINTRTGNGDENGIAGLINTKYLDNYDASIRDGIKTALNYTGAKSIQPLMIYNKTENAYGYFGQSISLSASSTTTVSVKVRVVGDAKAYIYVVDTSSSDKKVMNLTVTVNTDGTSYLDADTITTETRRLMFKVSSDMMNEDGWLTLTFYIANGNVAKNYRVELWNGARDGSDNSRGYVFFDEISTGISFTEVGTDDYKQAFVTDGVLKTALQNEKITENDIDASNKLLHKRELDSTEVKYNADKKKKGDNVSYDAKYVWVKTNSTIYAVYNNVEYSAVDPYVLEEEANADENETEEKEEKSSSTFWLSFSSILLGVVLVFALGALIVKTAVAKKKANANDAISHYNVKSRNKVQQTIKEKKSVKAEEKEETEEQAVESETVDEQSETEITDDKNDTEIVSEEEQIEEQPTEEKEEYIYGEVQDFGTTEEKNETDKKDEE
ncbi:MAG: hypothetical protein IJR66_03170 [Clostridia bacterium]|nr:hypothetical protein [Clostridia bacterium]